MRMFDSLGNQLSSIEYMDVFLQILNKYKFERVSSTLNKPIVVHSVPGAGKSSAIRELLKLDSRFECITRGRPDIPNLEGAFIKAERSGENKLLLVDEYIEGPVPEDAFAIFADPLQSTAVSPYRANFIKTLSHRFGKCTASLLRDLGWDVQAEGQDSVQIADIFTVDPRDTIVYFEPEVGELLRSHGVEASCIGEVRGATFEHVTFVTSENGPLVDKAAAFQCLTRHTKSLLILCPDATYTAA
uniref:25K protein n=1 Tax=Potato virus S TaxID=12169 RepID=A0A2R3XVK5_9VIRU|nr:25K protein [Potato virus S]